MKHPIRVCRAALVALSPRFAVIVASMTAVACGLISLRYPPQYLFFPNLWAMLILVAGGMGMVAAAHPTQFGIAASGAALIAAALSRSMALLAAQIEAKGIGTTGYLVGATQWAAFAYFVWLIWIRLVVPWSAITREGSDADQ